MLDHVFVVQSSNYRWVIGHWVRELRKRIPGKTLILWLPISFSRRNFFSQIIKEIPLPRSKNYYFPFPTVFMNYFSKYPNALRGRSIVLYTHETKELGSIEEQVICLSQAKYVHFMCTSDRDRLVAAGLDIARTRVILGAVDVDCVRSEHYSRVHRTVLLASRYGPRKGVEILPKIVDLMADWHFTVIGPNWENFIEESGLDQKSNFTHVSWSRESRNRLMSENQVFLSLSSLEGGPIPLIDAMAFGMYPVATDTGFARDIILERGFGTLLQIGTSVEEVVDAITGARPNPQQSIAAVSGLTWDRIASQYIKDTSS